eukprot:1689936-Amphidinium_carterae.1
MKVYDLFWACFSSEVGWFAASGIMDSHHQSSNDSLLSNMCSLFPQEVSTVLQMTAFGSTCTILAASAIAT